MSEHSWLSAVAYFWCFEHHTVRCKHLCNIWCQRVKRRFLFPSNFLFFHTCCVSHATLI